MTEEVPLAYCHYRGRRRIVEIIGRLSDGWAVRTGKHRFTKADGEIHPLNAAARRLMSKV